MAPASRVGSRVWALSYAACASGILEPQREPPERNGTPRRRANWAAANRTRVGSGVPNVGAPDCIEIELEKVPKTTGAPGRTSCVKAMPAIASARIWARVPATVTGLMAPERMNGDTTVAWPAAA